MAAGFVHSLLFEGRLLVGAAPVLTLSDADLGDLQKALAIESNRLPGPRLDGALPILALAVPLVYRLGWRFLNPEPVPVAKDPSLRMPQGPRTAAEHLAGDVAFRFLPGLYHRAMSRDSEDELAGAIQELLRQWPLSGVLADISEPPTTPVEFDGHVGLGFLYAERWAVREKRAWVPFGAARDCLEVVYQSLGKSTAAFAESSVNPS